MQPILSVSHLDKIYPENFQALYDINLEINKGEVFALLGPNGSGKTTLINCICGINNPTRGTILCNGFNIVSEYKQARASIALVPQELCTDAYETVWATVNFSRGLFGKPPNPELIEKILRDLSLWEKKDARTMTLSGGMKRRVMIAKALSHEPQVLFLDEPTAGVDVELRRGMWDMVGELKSRGVTVILTTHYIEEAEIMADKIAIIRQGKILLVKDKSQLMQQLGKKQLKLLLQHPLTEIPLALSKQPLELTGDGRALIYTFDTQHGNTGIAQLMRQLDEQGVDFKDLHSNESSLEDIFVDLIRSKS